MNTKNLKIFSDFHHAGLLQSLILLFEKRLGGQVFRPIGTEWYDRGFWKIYEHPATVQQYLGIGGATPDETPKLNEVLTGQDDYPARTRTVYRCFDIDSGDHNKAITYEGFMSQHFDIVIASIPAHIKPFRKLCSMHPSNPRLLYQIGNAWNITNEEEDLVDGIISSAIINYNGGKPYVQYHQEFDTNIFIPLLPIGGHDANAIITSFVNCFSIDGLFADDYRQFLEIEFLMNDYKFYTYGGQCRDGARHGNKEIAIAMHASGFIWHTKRGGDGYGHVIHNAFAVGRPPVVKMQYYDGKMAGRLMDDGVTCIAIDGLTNEEVVNKIRYYSEAMRWARLCRGAYEGFAHKVNFNADANKVCRMLESL